MIILIDGPDKSGKTTLINFLIKKFPGMLIKITDRPISGTLKERNKIKEHYKEVMDVLDYETSFKFIILDRFFPSEKVYSIKRGYDAFKDPELQEIELAFLNKKHLYIYCNPGRETLSDRMKREPDDYVTDLENLMMSERYDKFFEETQLNKIEVDTNKTVEELFDIISDKMLKDEHEHKRHKKGQKGVQLSFRDTKR